MKKILSILLAMLMLTAVFCAAPVSMSAANVEVAETGATVSSDGTARLYFNMAAVSWWDTASSNGGNFGYFFNNSTGKNAWSAKAVKYSGNTYYIVIPAGDWAGVILTRNSVTSNASWNNKWNQTGDITLSATSNYISKFADGSASVTWGTAVKPASTASVTASATEVEVGTGINLTATLTSNADLNKISSVKYTVTPEGATVIDGVFTAEAAGEYTVEATVEYTPTGYASIKSNATATTAITVTEVEAPADPEPEVTEPVVTDPVVTDPVETEPVATEPAATEPVATDAPVQNNYITVYFTNTWLWTDITVYFWDSAIEASPAWPGNPVEYVETNAFGQDVYKATIPADAKGMLFAGLDNGNNTQSPDITDIKDGYGYYMDWNSEQGTFVGVYEYVAPVEPSEPAVTEPAVTEPVATDPVETEPVATEPAATEPVATDAPVQNNYITVYFTNAWMWTDITVYFWDSAIEASPAWPGNPVEYVETNAFGQDVYKATIPADAKGMLFAGLDNGNNTQSPDITDIKDGYGYYMDWNSEQGTFVGVYEYVTPVEPSEPAVTEPVATEPEATDSDEVELVTVFFQNNWLWSDVCIYFWGSAAQNPEWHGVPMDYYDNDGTYDYYSYNLPADVEGFLISGISNDNPGHRDHTPDIVDGYYEGICYYMIWDNGNTVGYDDIYSILNPELPEDPEDPEDPVVPDVPESSGDEEPATDDEIAAPDLVGSTVTLGGNLGVNFWFYIEDEEIINDENAKIIVNVPNSGEYTQIELSLNDGVWYDNYLIVTADVSAKELTSVIEIQLVASDYSTETYTYTVQDYCEYILANPELYPDEQELVKALLNYATASQLYFNYNTDNLANDTEYMTEADKVVTEADLSAFAPVIEGEGDAIKYYGASLVLKSETTLNIYFTVDKDAIAEEIPEDVAIGVRVNGLLAPLAKNGDLYVLCLDQIAAHDLDTVFVIECGDMTVEYSALSYAYVAQQKTEKPALVALANAIAAYNVAATAYEAN